MIDPVTGLLLAQAAIGGVQAISGLAKPRQKINTAISPEYKEAEQIAQNAAQSTSAAYELTRKQLASSEASRLSAASRGATGFSALQRAQQSIARDSGNVLSRLYSSELSQKSQELGMLAGAKMRTAGARERMQQLENSLAMQENAYKDQLVASGLQNVFGAISGGVSYQANMNMLDEYAKIYGVGAQTTPGAIPTFPGVTTMFPPLAGSVKPPRYGTTAIQPFVKPRG